MTEPPSSPPPPSAASSSAAPASSSDAVRPIADSSRRARSALRRVLFVCLGVAVLLAAAGGGLVWRLKQGPLPLPMLAGWVGEHLSDPGRGMFVKIENITLTLSNDLIAGRDRLEIHALNAAVTGADGRTLASVPEAALDLSASSLLRGAARPTRIELIRPQVTAVRRPDGGFGFDIGAVGPAEAGESTGVADDLLAALARSPDAPPASGPVLGALRVLAVRDGDFTLIDEGRGVRWRTAPATLVLQREAGGVDGRLKLALETPTGATPLDGVLTYDQASGETRASLSFSGLRPVGLSGMAADLAPLRAVDLPMKGRVEVRMGRDFRIVGADFSASGEAGTVTAPVPAPASAAGGRVAGDGPQDGGPPEIGAREIKIDVRGFDVAGRYEGAGRSLTLNNAELRLAGAAVQAAGEISLPTAGPLRPRGRAVLRLDGFEPARLAALSPALLPAAAAEILATVETALTGAATLEGTAGPASGGDLTVAVDMALGAGSLGALGGLLAEPLRLRDGRVTASAVFDGETLQPKSARVDSLSLDVGGPRLDLTAAATTSNGRATATLEAALAPVPVADLPRLWPPAAAHKARDWVLQNLTGGTASKIVASAVLSAPLADLSDVSPDRTSAQIVIDDGAVHYFRPLPPAIKIERTVADFDGKDFVIRIKGGEVHAPAGGEPVRAGEGVVHIFNVGSPREDLTVDIGLTGPLRSILSVVDMPPLGYPSKLDIKPENTAGHVDGRLKIGFPLFDSVKLDDVQVHVSAKATGAAVQKAVAGRNAADGDLTVELDAKSMTVAGKARFDGAPITVQWREIFDATVKGPGTVLEAQGRSDVKHLSTFGPDLLNDYGRGPVDVKVRYASGENRQATLNVGLDLTPADLDVDLINWRKPPGTAAQSRFVLHFKDGKPTRIADLRLDGAGLQASAAVTLAAGGNEVARIDAPRIKTATTDMAAVMTRAKDGSYQVKLTGDVYDLRGALKDGPPEKAAEKAAAQAAKPPPPMTIDMQLNRLLFGENRGVNNVEGRMRRENGDWTAIGLRGDTPPRGQLAIRLDGGRTGGDLTIDADDAGAALTALDVTDRVRGGVLKVRGRSTPATGSTPAIIDGTVAMTDYMLVDAPALARILNAMSVTGLAELLTGEGIGFGNLTGSFRKRGDQLRLRDVRTAGGALGLTVEGDIDLARDAARLNGTIVPVYTINRLIGQIPLLGDLLSGGPGQGIFAATWTVEGPLSDPQVSVNPLALLTPGFLRNLFFSGQ